MIIGLVIGIVALAILSIVLGVKSLNGDEKAKSNAIWAIVLGLISCTIIGAILGICGLVKLNPSTKTNSKESSADALEKYHKLWKSGAISKEEYEEKKNSILGK